MTEDERSGVEIRPFRPGDEESINEGFNRVFHQSRSLEEWAWKFSEEPEGRWIVVARAPGGPVLVHYAAVPVLFQLGDRVVRAGQALDAFSRTEARVGLAAARLYLATVGRFFSEFGHPDRLSFLFGFPSIRAFRIGVAKLGYDAMPPRPVTEILRRPGRRSWWPTGHRVRAGWEWAALDAFWERSRHRYQAAAVRDSLWLRRRYTGRPDAEYAMHSAWRRNGLAAWAVTRRLGDEVILADLCWDGVDPGALAALDRVLRREAREAGTWVRGWLDGDPQTSEILRDFGWQERPQPDGLQLVARSFDPSIRVDEWGPSMYITLGDSDLV